jgi:hypothetical protein
MYWGIWVLWLLTEICYLNSVNDLKDAKADYQVLYREMIKSDEHAGLVDSQLEAQRDTIKVLKFKLLTLKSNE